MKPKIILLAIGLLGFAAAKANTDPESSCTEKKSIDEVNGVVSTAAPYAAVKVERDRIVPIACDDACGDASFAIGADQVNRVVSAASVDGDVGHLAVRRAIERKRVVRH